MPIDDKVRYSDIITKTINEWDVLKERVIKRTRFFTGNRSLIA